MLLEGIGRDEFLWGVRPGGGRQQALRRSQPIGDNSFQHWWVRCVAAAGVRYRNPHMTRHTCATAFRGLGLAMEEIQMILGHESLRTTADTYVHTNLDVVGGRMREVVGDLA